jgi:hypothetical protein
MKSAKFVYFSCACAMLFLVPNTTEGRIWWSGRPRASSYEVQVLVDGYVRTSYHHHGHTYVEGRQGERYVIRVHNRSWRRVEAIISVDGRDVIDGKKSKLSKRGYIIPAYSYIDVDGFRISMHEVAAFRFTSVPDSYASRMGTPWEVGIIGVAIFPERTYRPPPPRPPYVVGKRKSGSGGYWSESEDSLSASDAAPRSRNIGTQFGERRASPVSETTFVRQNWSRPGARLSLRYDDRSGLCSIGVGAFCYHPPWPPPYEPPYEPPYDPPQDFSEPPPGWDHFSPWY